MFEASTACQSCGQVQRARLLFTLLLLCSFIGALVAGRRADPWIEVAVAAFDAVLALGFAMPIDGELLALLKLPRIDRQGTIVLAGAAVGCVVLLIGYFGAFEWMGLKTLKATPLFIKAAWPIWSIYLVISVLPAVIEEFTFRGVIQTSLERVFRSRETWLIQAALFSILHLLSAMFPSHFLMGPCFGFLRNRSKSLYAGMLLHAAWNAMVLFHELNPS